MSSLPRAIRSQRNGVQEEIHAIFNCTECEKEWQQYGTARASARRHALKTGHKVTGEIAFAVSYHFYAQKSADNSGGKRG